jgi:hypothetical protein
MKQILPKRLILHLLTQILTVLILFGNVLPVEGSNHFISFTHHSLILPAKPDYKISVSSSKKEILSELKSYRVQVCALRNKIKDISLLEKACGQNKLIAEKVDGYYKYLTNDLSGYPAVLKTLYDVKKLPSFEGSFIVLYENGTRVKSHVFAKAGQVVVHPIQQTVSSVHKEIKGDPAVKPAVIKTPNPTSLSVLHPIADNVQKKIATVQTVKHPVLDIKTPKQLDSIGKVKKSFSIEKGFTNKIISSNLIIFILLFFAIGFLILVLFLIVNHFWMIRRNREAITLSESYAEKLAEIWSKQPDNAPVPELFIDANSDFKKDILIKEIITFLSIQTDELGNKIRDLYFKLELDFYSFQKLSNRKWMRQAKGIHELAVTDAQHEADAIEEFINHPNPILRHEAIAAIVRLRPSDPFGFLDRLTAAFTKKDQINVWAVLQKHHLPVPAFSRWFDSYNPSVVAFAVDMVSLNNQLESAEMFDKLLRHSYEEVKICVIKAIGDMHLTTYATRLIPIFNDEHERLQLLILQTIGKLEDLSMLNFLSDIVLFNTSIKIRLEAAKALVNIGYQGLTRLQTLLLNQDKDVSYIYHQICG